MPLPKASASGQDDLRAQSTFHVATVITVILQVSKAQVLSSEKLHMHLQIYQVSSSQIQPPQRQARNPGHPAETRVPIWPGDVQVCVCFK